MNVLATPFRQLVERRLWPLAVVLIVALVAVPVLLSKKASEPAAPGPVASTDQGATESVVSLQSAGAHDAYRHVLGSPKNPFRPAIAATKATPTPTPTAAAAGGGTSSGSSSSSSSSSGGSSSGGLSGSTAPVTVTPVTPTAPKKTFELYSLAVRFGASTEDKLPRMTVKRLKALPNDEDPALIYLGVMDDHKTAVFLVDATAKVQGDAHCDPSPSNCQRLRMRPGDIEFIDVTPEDTSASGTTTAAQQYELDLLKIHTSRTADAKAAKSARAAVASGGRAALRAQMSRVGALRYDPASGTLHKLSPRAYKAALAGAR